MPVLGRASIGGHSARLLGLVPWLLLGCTRGLPAFTDDGGSDESPDLDPYPYATQGGSSEDSSSSDTDTETETETETETGWVLDFPPENNCDPLIQDCPPDQGCYWENEFEGFGCRALGNEAGFGEACIDPGFDCLAGLWCVPESNYFGGCSGGPGCCSPLCNLEFGEGACGAPEFACMDLGVSFTPNVGVCVGATEFVPGDLQIVEIFADPPGVTISEMPYEFVEILNMSDKQLDLGLLWFGDYINQSADSIQDNFEVVGGDGGCVQASQTCLAPGRRALFVGNGYVGPTGGALVISSHTAHIFGALLQPFTRIKLYELGANGESLISTYRSWNDPEIGPWPVDEQPIHRIDPAGPDIPDNWVSGPATPGF
ncbi:hypothetical protein DB30_07713 [Enhygromyxa salina]|uniref:LTD domain-containing protein n=1 Tax=Enhygromyxa salina TaxID=215803 RepID=A0A0C2A5P0_9BACT|nr:hypothetical protein [Enhygromyxa salina]KIG18698.1 hypothetical protein DB30_07713 [Enhygromyxa salina]